jgi:hypothetical protein
MAFSTDALTEVFPGATVSNGELRLPSGSIRSFVPTGVGGSVREMVFGLLDTIASSVSTGNMTYLTGSETQAIAGDSLVKSYSFGVTLDYDANAVEALLNVKSEPVAE